MKRLLSLGVLINLGILNMAYSNEVNVYYHMMVEINNMECDARLNGVYLFNTKDVKTAKGAPRGISFGQGMTEYVDEGENILSIRALNIAKYVKNPVKTGYCDVKIVAMVKKPGTESVQSKVVNHIRYTYLPNDVENATYPYILSVSDSNLSIEDAIASKKITLEDLETLYDADKKPMQYAQASRSFNVHHTQPYRWVHQSTPFTDTPANKQLVWEKYNELRDAIIKKDKKAFRALTEPGLTDNAKAQGDDVDSHFDIVFEQVVQRMFDIDKNRWAPYPLTIDDYDLEIYAGGKLFRLNRKNYRLNSPLTWKERYGTFIRHYNPIFTFIDGKVVMASF